MMRRITTTLFVAIVLFSGVVTLGAATQPKFRPSSVVGAGVGRYVVTLTEEAGFDAPAALRQELELAQLYGAKLEATASSAGRQFAVTMTYARARLLSSDSRVIEVAEVPPTIAAPTSAAPPPTTRSHLTPRTSSYGDNGQSGTYTYDGSGNITAIGADTYVYDGTQRLVSSVTRGVQENYTYDAYGNRTSATGAVNCLGQTNCAQTVTVDSNTNHLTTIKGAAVTYDAAGNIKTIAASSGSPGAVYSYDALGMMTEATVGSDDRQFLYTADDERIAVRQGVSWTWMIRDQSGKVLREFTSLESGSGSSLTMTNWQWAKDYVWRDGLLLATVSPSGTLHYHLDHLGTPRLVTDANGVKVAEHAYYPFGAEINLTPHETPEEAMKFTGHERDIVAGDGHTLDYMHARYDNASLGRFLSVDPIMPIEAMRVPQLWNRYSYVGNNPVGRVDPTGRVLQFFGGSDDLDKVKKIANSGLNGYQLNMGANGVASLSKVKANGNETKEQKALREGLQRVIGDKATTAIDVASHAQGVVIGQFNMRTIDPGDMQKFGSAQPSAASTLGHEVMEQYAGQVLGMTNIAVAHTWAIQQENLFTGWTRGAQTQTQRMPNGLAYGDVRYTRGNEAMDVRVIVDPRTYDVTSVMRIPVP
jgi:RHS repeat-associated protein